MRYALIRDGVVHNAIEAGEEFAAAIAGDWDQVVQHNQASPGWVLDGGELRPPAPPAPAAPSTILTRLQFRSRFTAAEKTAIYEAAAGSAAIRVWLDDLAVAEDVRLDFPDTIAAVQALEAGGLLAPGRAAEILTP